MTSEEAHITLPEDLMQEIDALVGPDGRKAFLEETARAELRKRRLLAFLQSDTTGWKEENHPEWINGSKDWVEALRKQSDGRIPRHADPESAAD